MNKSFLLFCLALLGFSVVMSQNPNCPGLKNPSNFTLTGGTVNAIWTGYTGTKGNTVSTCTNLGATFSTTIPAANLSTTQSSGSCYSTGSLPSPTNRFVICNSGTDPLTNNNLTFLPPDPSFTSSIRLGNPCVGAEAEMLTYEFDVNNNNALITIWFCMSLENALHEAASNPEFYISVEKQTSPGSNNWQLAMGDTLCYIQVTPVQGSTNYAPFSVGGSGNLYLDWRKVIINLSKLLYQRVRIKIVSSDCAASGHYAYCYVAGECQPMALRANGCAAGETDVVAEIKAPKGAISYAWYRSKTGKLNGTPRTSDDSYQLIEGQTDSILNANINQFIHTNGDTMTQNTFMCKMTTRMNSTYDVVSKIYTDVGNTKPTLIVDTILGCDGDITLRDLSMTPYSPRDSDLVDTNITQWRFYSTTQPTEQSLVGTYTGGSAHHTFPQGGNYCVRVRTSAVDTSCWNEKTVRIRTIKRPVPMVNIERNNLCAGDTITISDMTDQLRSTFHEWHIGDDTTYQTPMAVTRQRFDRTTDVTLLTRGHEFFRFDTTGDGLVDDVYCYSDTTFRIFVEDYPELTVVGDTIVCNGDQSDVHVESSVDNCRFDWYQVYEGTTPVIEDNNRLVTSITQDRRYYVKVTSTFGCITWDSIDLFLVKPDLTTNKDRICTGDSVTLTAGRAAWFEWNSNPPDPNLNTQSNDAVVTVSPRQTTTYTVVGRGTNGCSATPLTQKILVFDYPIMQVQLTPDYIDSENPSVQFADLSENGTASLWNFGDGSTSQVRTVVHSFSDLSQDSILITLVTANPLGCTSDTQFYVPVGIFAVWFPNAFTPKLETNNYFKAYTANELVDYELHIYDRGGNLVFTATHPEMAWDGTYKGHECNAGSYVYIATYRRKGVDRLLSQKGTVTLIK